MRSSMRAGLLMVLCATALAACGGPASDPAAAMRRFLAERSSGVASVSTRQVLGTIIAIDGPIVTLQTPLSGDVEARITETTAIRRQSDASVADIAKGETITAIGMSQGSELLAERVQIGVGSLLGASMLQIGAGEVGPAASADVVPLPEVGDGVALEGGVLAGTVVAVDGRTLRIRLDDGQEKTVRLADSAVVSRAEAVGPGELQLGMFIAVTGRATADGLDAATMELLPPPQSR